MLDSIIRAHVLIYRLFDVPVLLLNSRPVFVTVDLYDEICYRESNCNKQYSAVSPLECHGYMFINYFFISMPHDVDLLVKIRPWSHLK